MKLRPNQLQAVEDIREFIKSPLKDGIVISPVATGKSILVAEAIKLLNCPVLILQPNKELLKQNYEKYTRYGFEASIYSASLGEKNATRTTFATIGSIVSDLQTFKDLGVKAILLDECHYSSKEQNQLGEVYRFLGVEKLIGLTATPFINKNTIEGSYIQMMNRSRECLFNNIIHVTQIQDILQYWTPIDYRFSKGGIDSSMLKLNSTGKDYTAESLKRFYHSNSIEYKILRSVSWLKERGVNQALIFVPSVAEAQSLAEQIIGAEVLHGGTKPKERERIVEGFKEGIIPYVVNVDVLGTGFDSPELPAIIHGRPTNSIITYYQHIGRGVRVGVKTKKEKVWFLDLVGNVEKFGKIENLRLEQDKKGNWELFLDGKQLTSNGFKPKVISMSDIMELQENIRTYTLSFGKYAKYNLVEVVKKDKQYLKWLASDKFEPFSEGSQKDKEAVKIILKHFKII